MASWMKYFIAGLGSLVVVLLTGLLSFNTFVLTGMDSEVGLVRTELKDTNNKILHHLTNEELHSPRSMTVLNPEFQIYRQYNDETVRKIYEELRKIYKLLPK